MDLIVSPKKDFGIPWCLSCVGFHPDQFPTIQDCWNRMNDPQKEAWAKNIQLAKKRHLYAHKSSMICGRTYDKDGNEDTTRRLTAQRVKAEFENAGVFGMDDKTVELVVAECRKSVLDLLENRMKYLAYAHQNNDFRIFEIKTFVGKLTSLITGAQEGRRMKMSLRK